MICRDYIALMDGALQRGSAISVDEFSHKLARESGNCFILESIDGKAGKKFSIERGIFCLADGKTRLIILPPLDFDTANNQKLLMVGRGDVKP